LYLDTDIELFRRNSSSIRPQVTPESETADVKARLVEKDHQWFRIARLTHARQVESQHRVVRTLNCKLVACRANCRVGDAEETIHAPGFRNCRFYYIEYGAESWRSWLLSSMTRYMRRVCEDELIVQRQDYRT
jgi:hypothetical protein